MTKVISKLLTCILLHDSTHYTVPLFLRRKKRRRSRMRKIYGESDEVNPLLTVACSWFIWCRLWWELIMSCSSCSSSSYSPSVVPMGRGRNGMSHKNCEVHWSVTLRPLTCPLANIPPSVPSGKHEEQGRCRVSVWEKVINNDTRFYCTKFSLCLVESGYVFLSGALGCLRLKFHQGPERLEFDYWGGNARPPSTQGTLYTSLFQVKNCMFIRW